METEKSVDYAAPRNPFKGRTGVARLVHAFSNSCSALDHALRNESAFRQEILLSIILVPVAFWVQVTRAERALLVASVLLMIVVELLNTGIEAAIDRISYDHHELSKCAKDMGSAAVLISIVLMIAVWAIILLPAF